MTDQNKPEDAFLDGESPAEPVEEPAAEPKTGKTAAKASGGAAARPGAGDGGDELPYIDDAASKWWIGAVVAVFVVIFAWALLFGAGGLFADLLDSGDPAPTPEATLLATAEPSAAPTTEVSPKPTAEPTAAPTSEVSPEPTAEPTAAPTPEVSPEPTGEPSPEPTPLPSG